MKRNLPQGLKVMICRDILTGEERGKIQSYFRGNWIWDHPLTLIDDYAHGDKYVYAKATHPDGMDISVTLRSFHIKPCMTVDEIRADLLQIKGEIDV